MGALTLRQAHIMLSGYIRDRQKMNLFSNPGWDINTGLQNHGEAPYKPEVDKWHKVKLSFSGTTIKVFYDGKMMIETKDNQYKSGTVALGNQDKIVDYDNVRITVPIYKLKCECC